MTNPENSGTDYPAEWDSEEPLSVDEINILDPDPLDRLPVYYFRALCRAAIIGGEKKYFLLTFPLKDDYETS
jgi:hypothetical protein